MDNGSRSPRKRIKLAEGDVFEFAVPDGRLGYGIILRRGALVSGGTPYIALFSGLYDKRPHPDGAILEDQVVLAGWTMDGSFYHGRWKVIAHALPCPLVAFPNFKVGMEGKFYVTDVDGQIIDEATEIERELLDYQFSQSPARFQDAFEAMHGFAEWQDHFEKLTPAHSEARSTRPKA